MIRRFIGVIALTALAFAARAEASGLPSAMELYRESLSPPVEYAAVYRSWTPVGSSELEVVRSGGSLFVCPRWDDQLSAPPPGRGMGPGMGRGPMMRRGMGRGPMMRMGHRAPQLFSEELLSKNYTLRISEGDSILSRPTWKIEIRPRWSGSPSRAVWVDRETSIRLRSQDRNFRGQVIQESEAVQLTVGATRQPEEFEELPDQITTELSLAEEQVGFKIRVPRYLPPGYQVFAVRVSPAREGMAHLLLFDGLGMISLVERPIPWWARFGRPPVSQVESGFAWNSGGYNYLLVGDLPGEQMEKMARSLGKR